jgi:type I restriction enzyme S subunit
MWSDDGLPWVAIADMTRSPVIAFTDRAVSEMGVEAKQLPLASPGTLLFAMYASLGSMAVLGIQATWNQAILSLEPIPDFADVRFLRYWLEHLRPDLRALARSNTQDNLNAEQVGNLPFPDSSLSGQRAIADYLDAETARIQGLIVKKERMIDLLQERRRQLLGEGMASFGMKLPCDLDPDWASVAMPAGWRVIHLNQCLLQLTNGYVGPTRDILHDEGIRYIQSLHIKDGHIDFSRGPFYVSEEWHRERSRIHLREGDVLIVQTGDIGQVAVVPSGFGEASCHALQIARVRPDVISGGFLTEYLRTPFGYESLLKRATGALHPHLEGGIRDVPVVVPPRRVQDSLVETVRHGTLELEKLLSAIAAQLDLLTEHLQALITAAVRGELDIPGVAA